MQDFLCGKMLRNALLQSGVTRKTFNSMKCQEVGIVSAFGGEEAIIEGSSGCVNDVTAIKLPFDILPPAMLNIGVIMQDADDFPILQISTSH